MKILPVAVLGLIATAGSLACAETIVVDDQVAVRESSVAKPARGATMKTVESQFGAPATRRLETDRFGASMYGRTEENDRRVLERLGILAERRGLPRARLALAWLLAKPGVTAPIVGATRPQHLEDAAASLALRLEPEERAALEAPYLPHPVLGFS